MDFQSRSSVINDLLCGRHLIVKKSTCKQKGRLKEPAFP
jgi:hypothetical protein